LKRIDGETLENKFINEIKYVDEEIVVINCEKGAVEYGHFLVATLDKFWYLFDDRYRHLKNLKIVLTCEKWEKWFDFLILLGFQKEQIMILTDVNVCQFKKCFVPEPSFTWGNAKANFQFCKIGDYLRSNAPNTYNYEKIYFSRTSFDNNRNRSDVLVNRKIYGEQQIENIFRKNGFEIIHPNKYSIAQQMSLLKNCKVLAGVSGSALHQSLFLQNGSEVIMLGRNDVLCGIVCQSNIDRLKEHKVFYIEANVSPIADANTYSMVNSIIGVNFYLKRFFDENGYLYNEDDLQVDRNDFIDYLIDFGYLQQSFKREINSCRKVASIEMESMIQKKYPKFLVNFMCVFIIDKNKRDLMRKKYLKIKKRKY
jgi:hypothetical protein